MNCEDSIVIHAPPDVVFRVVSDLANWPKLLPHYRWIRVLQRHGNTLTVRMAARRAGLPIQWTSRFEIHARARELRFLHLTAFTKGMEVTWTLTPVPGGVQVRIRHALRRSSPFGRWFATRILQNCFIAPVASQTLHHFKRHFEHPASAGVYNCAHHV